MAANTAKGAGSKDTRTITFKNNEHKKFYKEYLRKCRYQVYHKALVYCLGIDRDTRVNVDRIYDFYCNGTPSVYDTEDVEEQLKEFRCYTVEAAYLPVKGLQQLIKTKKAWHKPVIPLQFSKGGSPEIEKAYATHYVDLERVEKLRKEKAVSLKK